MRNLPPGGALCCSSSRFLILFILQVKSENLGVSLSKEHLSYFGGGRALNHSLYGNSRMRKAVFGFCRGKMKIFSLRGSRVRA